MMAFQFAIILYIKVLLLSIKITAYKTKINCQILYHLVVQVIKTQHHSTIFCNIL